MEENLLRRVALAATVTFLFAACGESTTDPAARPGDASLDMGASESPDQDGAAPQEEYEDGDHEIRLVEVVSGLEHPWGLAFLPSGDMLITERPGRLRIVRGGELVTEPVIGTPEVSADGQGGLLDIALGPGFESNRYVYMTYSKPLDGGQSTTAVGRARFEEDQLHDLEDLFVAEARGGNRHYGSRVLFDRDGMLFVTIGERGEMERAQDLGDHAGTTVRLHADGRVPDDNPFIGQEGVLPEIFSYGHRNAQGMALHPQTGAVWQNEHGPRGGDEINVLIPGANYGWPEVTHGIDYTGAEITPHTELPGMESPLLDWTPSIAPSGMTFYTGDRFRYFRGNVFNGALAGRHLRRVVFDGLTPVREQLLLEDFGQRIRDVREGPDGYLYILTDDSNGVLARLEPGDD